jgi:DNA-directed RNA polymerase specialized sigma24 family protein
MSSEGSVTHWIGEFKNGEAAAAQKLWEAYYPRLVGLARQRLGTAPRRMADEEDVALSAFNSFFEGVARGRFPQLNDRTDLWRLLVRITACKAIDLINHERRKKRGAGGATPDHDGSTPSSDDRERAIEQIVGPEPTPDFAVQVAEEYERHLQILGDAKLRSVAIWKLEGRTDKEVAENLCCTERTVERKVDLIRDIWGREVRL